MPKIRDLPKAGKKQLPSAILLAALIIAGAILIKPHPKTPRESPTGPKMVTKVIDGDTVIIEGGASIRLLGIDTDEKGYPCYESAKNRLEELVLNKEVRLEKDQTDQDQYKRYLRYIFLADQNINLELVKEGLAIARFSPENQKYKDEIQKAEKEAKEKKIGCKWGGVAVLEEGRKAEIKWKKLTKEATGLEVIDSCQAGKYIGKEKIVEGKIVATYRSKTNTVFLNFEKPYPKQCFNAVIFSSDQYKFVESPEKYYEKKMARIKGKIKEYKGKPEIILKSPEQIEVGE